MCDFEKTAKEIMQDDLIYEGLTPKKFFRFNQLFKNGIMEETDYICDGNLR